MSESEFLALEPRERDALVAEKVMGWTNIRWDAGTTWMRDCLDAWIGEPPEGEPYNNWPESLYEFTTDISAAWQVVEAVDPLMGNSPWDFVLARTDGGWICNFHAEWFEQVADGYEAPTAPLAICIAALKAKGVIE